MADDGNVTRLVDRLKAKTKHQQGYPPNLERLHAAVPIVADAIEGMRAEIPK